MMKRPLAEYHLIGLYEYVIVHTILLPSPVILWT